jgi:hypothetical protein
MKAALLVIAALAGGCLRSSDFHCMADSQCGSGGMCEIDVGYCSVPDSNCVQGRRYTEYSGSYTNQCVIRPDASVSQCAPGFMTLPGAPGHQYHLFTTPGDFMTQRTACAAQGPTSYLAIPDTAPELQAIVALAAQPKVWVGIDDLVVVGNFLTVRGMTPAYLPWAAGQPDNKPNAQCVDALPDGTIEDQVCSSSLPAVCECEP